MLTKRKITCSDVKRIDIVDFMATYGYQPKKKNEREAWYISPLRPQEKEPSFRVNMGRQLWYDFGLGDGGDIIKLGCQLFNCTVKELLEKLDNQNFSFCQPIFTESLPVKAISEVNEILEIKPISHGSLIQYIKSRGVSIDLAKRYCKEIWYANNDKKFFAIGFKSNAGFELRSKYFKGCTGKGISFLFNNSRSCTITEGFFDWMSLLMIYPEFEFTQNHIVLNSTSNIEKAEGTIKQQDHLLLYLDRDDAGYSALNRIAKMGINYSDQSNLYNGFNDLNEYLISIKGKV